MPGDEDLPPSYNLLYEKGNDIDAEPPSFAFLELDAPENNPEIISHQSVQENHSCIEGPADVGLQVQTDTFCIKIQKCIKRSLGSFVIIQLLLCLPTVQLILGIKYYYYTYEECPIKDGKVQLYLLVNGVSFTIAGLFAWMIASCNFYKKDHEVCGVFAILGIMVWMLFTIAWLITGSVWVFQVHNCVEHQEKDMVDGMLPIEKYEKIRGAFKGNKFNVYTYDSIGNNAISIKVYDKEELVCGKMKTRTFTYDGEMEHIYLSNYIRICNARSNTPFLDDTAIYNRGVWSFLITKKNFLGWFNGNITFNITSSEHLFCDFWTMDFKAISFNDNAAAIAFEDQALNQQYFGKGDRYCNKNVYKFAFATLIITYMIPLSLLILFFVAA